MWKKNYSKKANWKKGAHIHQPKAWRAPYACAQRYHPGSGSHRQLFYPYLSSKAWHSLQVYEERTRVSKTLYYRGECKQAIQQIAWLEPYTAVSPLLDRIRPLNLTKVCLLHNVWPELLFKLCFIGLACHQTNWHVLIRSVPRFDVT